ncbi:MAG: metal ABC transporter permease [Ardenticatenales bacterium]|nr:metal ABC transporter permease [Ardenticatenales bacterium]
MEQIIEFITGPLAYPFMVRGLIAAVLVGVVCAVVGTFVVLRGMAFFGDALSHAILPGLAVGYLYGGGTTDALFWWGLLTAILTSIGIGVISESGEIKEDTAIGIVFAGMFALGIAMISTVRSYAVDLAHILFGNVLGVSVSGLWLITIFGGAVILIILLLYKELVVISFDPVLGATLRLRTTLLHNLLMILIATTIVVSLQTVGVALMLAMLITPAASAYLLTRRLPTMMALAALIGALSGVVGLYLSYYGGIASGAAIVLVCTALFLLAFLFAPGRGWLWGMSWEKLRHAALRSFPTASRQ